MKRMVSFLVCLVCAQLLVAQNQNVQAKQDTLKKNTKYSLDDKKRLADRIVSNMVRVEGGTFKMGATSEQGKDAYDWEKPKHKVNITHDFYIGRYPVTQEEWTVIMDKNPSQCKKHPNNPVDCVSWDDCQLFIERLRELTGKQFRLPTEAEWEFAARGGKQSEGYKYAGGNEPLEVAWCWDNIERHTQPVGRKRPNELGLYDMSGNVFEWCSDWYGLYTNGCQTNPQGPDAPEEEGQHVIRGGSWFSGIGYCRVSFRGSGKSTYRSADLGIRLACTPW